MNNIKIYIGDGTEEYKIKKDKYGTPYITISEIIESLNSDERYDDEVELVKDIIKNLADNQDDDRIAYIAMAAINVLIKTIDDPVGKKIASALNIILKEIYD